jgi:hypothetical protein
MRWETVQKREEKTRGRERGKQTDFWTEGQSDGSEGGDTIGEGLCRPPPFRTLPLLVPFRTHPTKPHESRGFRPVKNAEYVLTDDGP